MTSPASLTLMQRRLSLLEQRVAELEGPFADTLYRLHRHSVRTDLTLARISEHLGIVTVTDDEVDEAIESADG